MTHKDAIAFECMRARGFADALEGIAEGMNRRFVLFRPPALVVQIIGNAAHSLRRMSDLLEAKP
jgi:hypothetical protein